MQPTRIMFIRHAEKPDGTTGGVTEAGVVDSKSLAPQGWQRAGALVRYFCPNGPVAGANSMKPATVFAASEEDGVANASKRPIETVTPLCRYLGFDGPPEFVPSYTKMQHQEVMDEVLKREGIVLVAWEHKQIPVLIGCIPGAPPVPQTWTDTRFDITWVLDRNGASWTFTQMPQLLLANDSTDLIQG